MPSATVRESHEMLNGVVTSFPISTSSTKNCTRTTPTLSDAAAWMLTLPDTVLSGAGAEMLTDGLTMSGIKPTFTIPTAVCPVESRISYVNTSLGVGGTVVVAGGVYRYGSVPLIVPPAELIDATLATLSVVPRSLARRNDPANEIGPAAFPSEPDAEQGHPSLSCGIGATAQTGPWNVCAWACAGITIVSRPARRD